MESRKYLVLILSLGCLGLFLYSIFNPGYSKVIPQSVQRYYSNWIEEHNQKIWDVLANNNISRERYQTYSKEYIAKNYQKELDQVLDGLEQGPPLSPKTKALVNQAFKDFNIDRNQISVVSYVANNASPAFAHDKALFIHEARLNQVSEPAQLFIIGHELSHVIFKDDSFRCALSTLLPPIDTKDARHPLNIIYRLQELRADMNAAVKSPEYAQGLEAFLNEYIELYGPGRGITHPTAHQRLQSGRPLLALYEKASGHSHSMTA